ncbi:MAG: SRPBCC domain-containing protein [Candidatus Limnocylindrales bacterium]|nr:SRPBCC domain-containing protein [Candidatus Limnocylindrales bacterium]
MKLAGRIEIAAPARDVWDLMIDPVSLAACVPGVQHVARVDDRTFKGTISAAVGPMEGQFEFASTIVSSEYPTDLQVETLGTDSVTRSQLQANVQAWLEPLDPGRTALAYRATVNVNGRLAIVGEMILRATAGVMIGELVKCLRARLEAGAGGRPAAADVAAGPPG